MALVDVEPEYTPAEYLARERRAEYKSEYLNGRIYAMTGASLPHNAIAANITAALVARLRGKPCQVFTGDLKVATSSSGLFAYPDLSVVCGEPQFHSLHRDVVTNPTVIVEVLSPSTEAFDRGRKFFYYRQIESLEDYLLVAQDAPFIDHCHKASDGRWSLASANGLDGSLQVPSIDTTLLLSEIYDKIIFPAEPDAAERSASESSPVSR